MTPPEATARRPLSAPHPRPGPARPAAPLALAAALALAACSSGVLATRRWSGTATPTTPGATCTPATATAQITEDRVIFAPTEGTWVLRGRMAPDGTIAAELTRPGADKQPFRTTFQARRDGDRIAGTYKTPLCSYDVALTRLSR